MERASFLGKSYAYLKSTTQHIRGAIQLNDFTLSTFHLAINESSPLREKLDGGELLAHCFAWGAKKKYIMIYMLMRSSC